MSHPSIRVCSDSGNGGIVNAMILGSVVGIARSVEELLVFLANSIDIALKCNYK